ncbi:Fc.00g001300.m01.CDS01 [Cosmosporella sp. VM-42]
MSSSILIKNATAITVDDSIGIKTNYDILIRDGVIKEVGPNLTPEDLDETIDATDCLVSPGFVDTHHHMWQQLIRGVTTDWSLGNYIEHIRNIYGSLYTPEDVYTANYFAGLDLINNGITTVIDHCHILNSSQHTDAAIKGLKDAGVRGTWCYGFYENPERHDLPDSNHSVATPAGFDHEARMEDAKRARKQHFPDNDPEKQLLTFGAAPTEAEGMTDAELREEIDFFRSIGARVITMHVAMGCYDRNHQIVQHLGDAKYLDKDLLFSHGASFTDSELKLIQEAGSGISATPETELQMGMGHPIAFKAAAAGCHIGLGIDITSNQNNDMLALMRLLLQTERGKRHLEVEGTSVPFNILPKSEEALYMATMGGAKSIGLDHLIGSITPGKRADLIITRCDDMNIVPVTKPIGALMFNAHIGNIDTVLINGKIMKRDGKVLNVDWPKLRQEVRQKTARIFGIATKAPEPAENHWTSILR